ncbi:hypothetical protein KSP40_PGU000020 [Platanthera guangdongensis]|uniref:Peptidase C1A papain C-terminal domain-containing protein n=1 Tax=Platanthera guangdongensis TaxID=2320717 RepID=A0ABR2LT16_9ASPA
MMNKGYRGGSYVGAFDFIHKNEIILEVAYPYTTKDGKCALNVKLILISKMHDCFC